MAVDYLIGTLIACSTLVNALALGAFWVTPSLRTTANRFVINLLIVNLVGCAALTPSLFGSWSAQMQRQEQEQQLKQMQTSAAMMQEPLGSLEYTAFGPQPSAESAAAADNLTSDLVLAMDLAVVSEATAANLVEAMEVVASIVAEEAGEVAEEEVQKRPADVFWGNTRHWGFDLTAALGALSVLLIVGDTFCAVTDPLRYHARISGPKAWIAIALCWTLSISFGIASAFRSRAPQPANIDETIIPADDRSGAEQLYDTAFAAAYFVLIILAPICLVCGMYWKIVTEAKQNGLRMRQNGSSPLLQSALNLAAASAHVSSASTTSCRVSTGSVAPPPPPPPLASGHASSGGLIMNIDQQRSQTDEEVEQVLPLVHQQRSSGRFLDVPTTSHPEKNLNNNNNTLMVPAIATLSVAERSQLTRNMSSRHLQLGSIEQPQPMHMANQRHNMDSALDEEEYSVQMRHVRSTPNLRRVDGAQHAVAMHTLHHHLHHQHQHHHNQTMQQPQQAQLRPHPHNHAVTVHVTPSKALCYMSSIRHRLSNASSIFKYREESRAARISVLVVVMYLVAYLPYGILVLLDGLHFQVWPLTPQCPLLAAVLLVMVSSIGSPVIFAYRNKRIRRGVARLFGLDAKTNERALRRQLSGPHAAGSQQRMSAGKLSGQGSRTSVNLLHVGGAGQSNGAAKMQQSLMPQPPPVTVSLEMPAEVVVASRSRAATRKPDCELAAIKQKLSVLRRIYAQTTRRLSCSGSTSSSSADESSAPSSGHSSRGSSSSSGSGSSRSGKCGGDADAANVRRQSSDV